MGEKIRLNNNFYTKNAIETALSHFSNVSNGKIISNEYEVELNPTEDIPNLKNEFINYVFTLMKNSPNEMETLELEKQPQTFINEERQISNFTRVKKIGDRYLIVDDFGNWTTLEKEEYNIYRRGNFEKNPELSQKLSKNNISLNISNIDRCVEVAREKKSFLTQGTGLHIVVLTKRCNHSCSYCQASAKRDDSEEYDMDISIAKKVVDRIFESPNTNIMIEFQGGEPLLNFETLKFIVEYANNKNLTAKKNLSMSVVTNFTLMDDEKLNFLLDNYISLCTSLDGPADIHNACREDHATVSSWIFKVQNILKDLLKKGPVACKLNALFTATKYSINNHKKIIDEYVKHGFHRIFIRQMSELGYGEYKKSLQPTAEEFIDFWKKSLDYIIELNKKGTNISEWKTLIILKKLFDVHDPNFTELRSPCGAVTGQLAYNYDGNVYTCDEGRMIEDDVFNLGTVDQSYTSLTTNSCACNVIASSINDTLYCDKCVYKPFCGVCPVLNYAINGSIINNIPSSNWCKIHKAQFDYIFRKLIEDEEAKKIFMQWLKNSEKEEKIHY